MLVSQFKIHGQYFNKRTVLEGLKDYLDGGKRRQLPGLIPPIVELYDPAGKHLGDISVRHIDLPFLCSSVRKGGSTICDFSSIPEAESRVRENVFTSSSGTFWGDTGMT